MLITPKFWYEDSINSKIKSIILFPLSILWILFNRLKSSFTKVYKSKLKVVCVGNLTVGGTGKTPYAIYTFKILRQCLENFRGATPEIVWGISVIC